MKNLTKILVSIYVAIMMIAVACKKDEPTPTPPVVTPTTTPPVVTKSSAKAITKFSFAALSPVLDATIDEANKAITATVPAATDITKLVPTITLSDKATISPATGVTQDFSKEVSYTVTAEDASTVVYKVNVKKEEVVNTNFKSLNSIIYIRLLDKTYAIDAQSKTIKWTLSSEKNYGGESVPAIANGKIYLSNRDKMYVLDANSGAEKWTFKTQEGSTSPTVSNDIVYIGDRRPSAFFYAFDANTGQKKWERNGLEQGRYDTSPTISDNYVYTVTWNNIIALDEKTGTTKWVYKIPGAFAMTSSPSVVNDILYVGGDQANKFYALNATTGDIIWTYASKYTCSSSPTVVNNLVYLVDNFGVLVLDAKTGIKKWEKRVDNITRDVTVVDGIVYATGAGIILDYTNKKWSDKVYAFDAITGEAKWTFSSDYTDTTVGYSGSTVAPTIANNEVYVSFRNVFYSINAKTGVKNWEMPIEGRLLSPPCVLANDGISHYPSISGMIQ